jgi:ABC-type glycerol-3-phosphate transport system substrate-binding protein
MRSALLTLALAALLSACSEDVSPVGPALSPVASLTTVNGADPLEDAIERIAPAFGQDASGLLLALQRVKNNEIAAVAIAEQQLARIERENAAFSADVDAIRLALNASR